MIAPPCDTNGHKVGWEKEWINELLQIAMEPYSSGAMAIILLGTFSNI